MALPNNTLDQYFTHSSHCRVGLCAACVSGYDFSLCHRVGYLGVTARGQPSEGGGRQQWKGGVHTKRQLQP